MIATMTRPLDPSLERGSLADALELARQSHRTAYYSQIERLPLLPDPLAFLEASSAELGSGTLWVAPDGGPAFASAGAAVEIRHDGPGRFSAASAALRDVRARLVRSDPESVLPIIGGFAFSDYSSQAPPWHGYPGALLVVPRALLQIHDQQALLRVTICVEPGSSLTETQQALDALAARARLWAERPLRFSPLPSRIERHPTPSRAAWEASVATAVSVIRQGMLDKVVLARQERLLADAAFGPVSTLARLRASDAAATLFARQSGSSWFIGATPERLVRLAGERVDVSCLAGSIGIGRSPRERQRLAASLFASGKDREEHEIVVRSTMAALEEVCEDVARLIPEPRVVAARSVQHLETPLTATLPAAGQVLDLVERLHPTPAVGGFPRALALNLIRELEEIDRGWYAAPFGWTDLNGSGEFAVALRCALVSGRAASLFAGSGIVADSIPPREYEETCLKLDAMHAALGAA